MDSVEERWEGYGGSAIEGHWGEGRLLTLTSKGDHEGLDVRMRQVAGKLGARRRCPIEGGGQISCYELQQARVVGAVNGMVEFYTNKIRTNGHDHIVVMTSKNMKGT